MDWINAVLQGVLLGGLYTLVAAGLSLMFGVMRIVNLAHGALAIVAAYLGVLLVDGAHLPPFATLALVVPAMAALGYGLQYLVFNRSLARGGLSPILVTFGLAVVVTNLLQELFTADTRSIRIGALSTSSIKLGGNLAVGVFPLLTFAVGVAAVVALQVFLSRTRTGRAMRAASDDGATSALMGIDNRRVYATATAIALATVGLAGVFLGMRTEFTPGYGDATLIYAFEAVIVGGLGSLWGTLAGGVVLGVAQAVGAQVNPSYGVMCGHLVFLVVLMARPSGLFGKAVHQ